MATIALYAGKINNMPSLIKDVRKSVEKYNNELAKLYQKTLKVDAGVCDLSDVIDGIRASSQTQEQRIEILENFQNNSEDFIQDTIRIDNNVADTVEQNKDDFYDKYDYLKPDCEKSGWEKFCDACKAVGEWCKEHWKLIVTVVLVIIAIVVVVVTWGAALGPLAAILVAACKGLIMGALIGGLSGGLESMANGGSFLDGFENGAFSGAISGFIMGGAMAGLGQLGAVLGKGVNCLSTLGKVVKTTSKITNILSTGMGLFDTMAMGDKLFGLFGGGLADLNAKLHSSTAYNIFQIGVSALAAFTGGMTTTMSCFVAGTLILTASGLVAIENIKAGDKVISTDPNTGVTEEKTVLEAFHRNVTELVHVTVGSEAITTTHNHPFYVAGRGFVNAGQLKLSDILISRKGEKLTITDITFESTEKPTKVYNFKVEDFHTYFVGCNCIFVHNADCTVEFQNKSGLDEKEYKQQLQDQQDGLNKMTVEEYLENRQQYNDRLGQTGSGRDPNSATYQQQARSAAISEKAGSLMESNPNMSYEQAMSEANSWAKGKAALHGPDQIAGGRADGITGLGDARINSSIGSQWKADSRIGTLDAYVDNLASTLSPAERSTTYLNVELKLTP